MRPSPITALLVLIMLSAFLATPGAASPDKLSPTAAVEFRLGSASGVFVAGTSSDPSAELAALPVGFRASNGAAPDSVALIQVTVTYDSAALEFVGFEATAAWPGDAWIDPNPGPNEQIIVLDSAVIPMPTDFLDVGNFIFTPLCQPELNPSDVTIDIAGSSSYVSFHDLHYYDDSGTAPFGTVTTADYDGYVSVLDPDPRDADPVVMHLDGVVGADALVSVPVYLSSNADVWEIAGLVGFDPARLEFVDAVTGSDCNPWGWRWGSYSTPSDSTAFLDVVNVSNPFIHNGTGQPCEVLTMTFRVLGDWRGQDTEITFTPVLGGVVLGSSPDACGEFELAYTYDAGTLHMDDYEASVRTVIDDMIYPADVGTNKGFLAEVQASHNYTIGGDTTADPDSAALRLDLQVAEGLSLASIDRPGADGRLWFTAPNYDKSAAKSMWSYEFYSELHAGVPDSRPPSGDYAKLFGMNLILSNTPAPASFDTTGYAITYLCSDPVSGRTARLRDAITDTIKTQCGDGLTFADAPALLFANGELICYQRTSTSPANVVQTYYARTSFSLEDFRVTVNKSGPHSIVSVSPAPGVSAAQASDHVTFTPQAGVWDPAVHRQFFPIGSITYSTSVIPTPKSATAGSGSADKGSGPPVTWCWKWTTISFGTDSYLHDATGNDTFLFQSTGPVGTRYDCSGVVAAGGTNDANKSAPMVFALRGNAPNPFNPQTTIAYAVPHAAHVTLSIHDIRGRRIAVLVDGTVAAGDHEVVWTGRDDAGRPVASGTYFAVMRADGFSELHKMVLLK